MKALTRLILPCLLALVVCILILMALGESPWVLWEAAYNTLFTGFGLGYTLYYSTPLIFAGLSVALSFHCGLFNIGAEGQLYWGAISIVAVSQLFPSLPWPLAWPLGILTAGFAGGLWGWIAGVLKAKRGSHEVIVTILLNFIAISAVGYCTLYPLKNLETQNPETVAIGTGYQIPTLTGALETIGINSLATTPANFSLVLAILLAFWVRLLLFRTPYGFELRTVGFNPTAARFSGISTGRKTISVFFLSGALAGLVGVNEVMGYQHKVVEGFSPGYGFTAIAVALLAGNNPLGVILSAFFFGALQNGSRELEFSSDKVSKELSLFLQGLLIAFVAAQYWFSKHFEKFSRKKGAAL